MSRTLSLFGFDLVITSQTLCGGDDGTGSAGGDLW
jgi:hypothetical protein